MTTAYVFDVPATPSVAIKGRVERFPVRRIFCVGRNYAAHAREMGKDPDREPPFFFTKPADAVVDSGAVIPYPSQTKNFQHEIELVIAIGKDGTDVARDDALSLVFGYAVGIDLTRRDLQFEARDKGRPWDWGKAFDLSAPIAPIVPVAASGSPASGRIWLSVNGEKMQDADLAELIWDVPEVISIISQSMQLRRGDLIMTGTPAGVGPINVGDVVTGGIEGLEDISITVGSGNGG